MKIGVGIDTGGTYTDVAVYDFETGKVLGVSKALTTKDDLSHGILNALDALPLALLQSADTIALSTTLATNACVEGRGGNAKLIFFGGNPAVIDRNGGAYGLPPADEICIVDSSTSFSGEIEREPDWEQFRAAVADDFNGLDGVGIVEMNASKNNAQFEKKAKAMLQQQCRLPVVCGHELFTELNSLQRGASTLLNARLFPVIQEFLTAIKTAMEKRGIRASVVIVRSDGSLMSEEFAYKRPVETLLCGPAASAMGSAYLTQEADAIVVDMGGTTTDIALVHNKVPVKTANGISIGPWKTFVNGLYIKTFGLGGDTAIHYRDGKAFLEEYRVTPLCVAAAQYPCIVGNLRKLLMETEKHTKYLYEHFILVKDISGNPRYTEDEQQFCGALRDGPLTLKAAAACFPGKDIYSLNVARLVKEGVVQVCGLTPTDIMHVKGDFSAYNAEASELGVCFVAANTGMTIESLCDFIYDEIKRKLYVHIVIALLENKNDFYSKNGISAEVTRFINESYEFAKEGKANPCLSMRFATGFTLTGIGAPIPVFLQEVAGLLGTKAVIPAHYAVANAMGAIVGSVRAVGTAEIKPNYSTEGITGYTVYAETENQTFETVTEAEAFAMLAAQKSARAKAVQRGAVGEITVTCSLTNNEPIVRECTVYLGAQAVAQAVGAVGF